MLSVKKAKARKSKFRVISDNTYGYLNSFKNEGYKWTRFGNIIKKGEWSLYVPKFCLLFFLIGFEIPFSGHFNLIEKAYLWYIIRKYVKKEIK